MKKAYAKNGKVFTEEEARAPLNLCVDPEFDMLKEVIKQVCYFSYFI